MRHLQIIRFSLCVWMVLIFACRSSDQGNQDQAEVEKLKTLPYVSFSTEEPEDKRMGVTVFDQEKASPGYNLYSSRTSFEAFLIDLDGNQVHRWGYSEPSDSGLEKKWETVRLLKNGDLVVLHKFHKIFRLDWNSNLVWKENLEVHHDLDQKEDGNFYVVAKEHKRYNGQLMRFPLLLEMDPAGRLLKRWAVLDSLEQIKKVFDRGAFPSALRENPSSIKTFYRKMARKYFGKHEKLLTPFHANTVKVLPDNPAGKQDERFKAGNLLVCFRNINQIGVLDPEREEYVWAWGRGELEQPHHPQMLGNGNVLIFDNGVRRKYSRILELNPTTGKIEWEYKADPRDDFYSVTGGSVQRLPNGNTLITETRKGRVFEVTKSGEIVWEWLVPLFDKNGYRGTIYRMTRHPSETIEGLLKEKG